MADSPDVIAAAQQINQDRLVQHQQPLISNLFGQAAPDITQYQQQRAAEGYNPYNASELKAAAPAVTNPAQATQAPSGNFFQNLVSDVGNLATSIPKLPLTLAEEPSKLGEYIGSGQLSNSLSQATNPLQALGAVAQTPGARLIPGSFIASQFAPGQQGISGLAAHPLYTALDVLPYASKAASLTHTVAESADVANQATQAVADAGLRQPYGGFGQGPITTFLRNYQPGGVNVENVPYGLDQAGAEAANLTPGTTVPQVQPGVIGRPIVALKNKLAPIGSAFSGDTRLTAIMANRAKADILAPSTSVPDQTAMEQASRVAFEAAQNVKAANPDLTPQDWGNIGTALRTDQIGTLPEELQPIAQEYKDNILPAFTESQLDSGNAVQVQFPHGPEIYSPKMGEQLQMRRAGSVQRVQDIVDNYHAIPGGADDPATAALLNNLSTHLDNADWHQAIDALDELKSENPIDANYTAAKQHLLGTIKYEDTVARPARWDDLLRQKISDVVASKAPKDADPQLATIASQGQLWGQVVKDPAELQDIINETASTWRELAEQGLDPTYVHNVTDQSAVQSILQPRIADYTPSVSNTRERLLNPTATTKDPFLALSHQALEYINRDAMNRFVNEGITRQFAVSEDALQQRFLNAYKEQLADLPSDEVLSRLKTWRDRDWRPFDPDQFFNPNAAKSTPDVVDPASKLFLPKDVYNALQDIKANQPSRLAKIMDPFMKTYRTSVMTLSPRFWVHAATNGLVMSLLQLDNPLTDIAKYAQTAWQMAKDPTETLAADLRSGATDISRADIRDLPPSLKAGKDAIQNMVEYEGKDIRQHALNQLFQFEQGKGIRKLLDNTAVNGAADKLAALSRTGQNLNAFMKDFWINVNYLSGYDRSLLEGVSKEQAIAHGVEAGRRLFETWDSLTPTERTGIRTIMPFYGMARNLLKFVAQYPGSHPTRLSILSNFAKAEQQDFGNGLPQALQQLLFLSPTSTMGRVNTIAPGALNPFKDVSSYASLLGFMTGSGGDFSAITRNVNPAIAYALDQMGIDTTKGQADLYPDLYVDPATGNLAVKPGTGGATGFTGLAQKIMPQTELLNYFTGQNDQFKAAMASGDHETAARMVAGAMGIPVYTKTVDLPAQRLHQEVTLEKQQETDFKDALKTGDWREASKWPGLQPAFQKLGGMSADDLHAFLQRHPVNTITPKAVMKAS